MSDADAPSTSAAKARAVVGGIPVFLGEQQGGYRSYISHVTASQLMGNAMERRAVFAFYLHLHVPVISSHHNPETCHELCIISINQKSHKMVQRQGLDPLLSCRKGHLPVLSLITQPEEQISEPELFNELRGVHPKLPSFFCKFTYKPVGN